MPHGFSGPCFFPGPHVQAAFPHLAVPVRRVLCVGRDAANRGPGPPCVVSPGRAAPSASRLRRAAYGARGARLPAPRRPARAPPDPTPSAAHASGRRIPHRPQARRLRKRQRCARPRTRHTHASATLKLMPARDAADPLKGFGAPDC
jgi:hypothetical protein